MSANLIIFDPQYISEQVKNLDKVHDLIEQAVSDLKRASLHEGWKCRECNTINNNLDSVKSKLGKLNQGVSGTSQALNKGMNRFQELEARAETQTNNLSSDLKEKYGFSASNYGQGGKTDLPVGYVPETQNPKAQIDGLPSQNDKNFFEKLVEKVLDLFSTKVYASADDFQEPTVDGVPVSLINREDLPTEEKKAEYDKALETWKMQEEIKAKLQEQEIKENEQIRGSYATAAGVTGTITAAGLTGTFGLLAKGATIGGTMGGPLGAAIGVAGVAGFLTIVNLVGMFSHSK